MLITQAAAFAALLCLSLNSMPAAFAQDDEMEDELSGELIEAELTETEEEAPAPEYPYPGAKDDEFKQKPAARASNTVQRFAKDVERPVKIDEDEGSYYYDTNIPDPTQQQGANDAPKKTNKAGEFFYEKGDGDVNYQLKNPTEKPVRMTAEGGFRYKTESTPQNRSANLKIGMFSPTELKNPETGSSFEKIYKQSTLPVVLIDFDWRLVSSIGRLSVKATSGIYSGSGTGEFRDDTDTASKRRLDDIPNEKFTFLLFPNQLTAVYKFQYADEQILVPYVEGGLGYFTFAEIRDDGSSNKYGGSLVTVAAAGGNLLLDWMDRQSIRNLDNEYGINHVWLTAEYRYLVGLNKVYDFTSGMISAGLMVDF